jgi:hypothetical protein
MDKIPYTPMNRFSDQLVTPGRLHDLHQLPLLFRLDMALEADGDWQRVGCDRVANCNTNRLERNRLSECMAVRDHRTRRGVPGVDFYAAHWWDGWRVSGEGFGVGFRGRTTPQLGPK